MVKKLAKPPQPKAAAPAQPKRLPLAAFVQALFPKTATSPSLVEKTLSSGLTLYLVDSELPHRLLTQFSISKWGMRPQACTNLDELASAVDLLSTPPLFGETAPLLVTLPSKLTKANWTSVTNQCARLCPPSGGALEAQAESQLERTDAFSSPPVWFLGPTSLRKSVTEIQGLENFLGYAPTRSEAVQIVAALHARYDVLTARPKQQQNEEMTKAMGVYDTDFVLMDEHFERMQQMGLPFDEVFTDLPLMGVYQFIEALPTETLPQLVLRLEQCQRNGEEPSRVLAATGTFFRQFIRYCVMTRSGTPESQVFQSLGIPFPAQAKFTAARKKLSPDRVLGFLARSPELELKIRQSYRGPEMLAVEFIELFS